MRLQVGIEPQCNSLLRRLYADRQATVMTDKESDVFEIKRGTKQGDPLSSLLLDTVLQAALRDDLTRWCEQMHGYTSGRFTGRLPLQPAICGRRAIILHIAGAAEENDE